MASKPTKTVKRSWVLWAVVAPWGIRAVAGTRSEAAMYKFNEQDKLRRVRVTEVTPNVK